MILGAPLFWGCEAKIVGSTGTAACMDLIDNRYSDNQSDTKRNIPHAGFNDDGYYPKHDGNDYIDGTEAIQKPDLSAHPACGESGSIAERIQDCNFTWNASGEASNLGHGSWTLVTKTTNNGYQVWRDDRMGLLWSDRMGVSNHCIASGDIEDFDQAAAISVWDLSCRTFSPKTITGPLRRFLTTGQMGGSLQPQTMGELPFTTRVEVTTNMCVVWGAKRSCLV